MMRIALVLLVGCSQTVPRKPHAVAPAPCADGWLLMRAVQQCGDLRSGWSGYWVLEVTNGPHAGRQVLVSYGEGYKTGTIGQWNLSKTVTFRVTPEPSGRWPNECNQFQSGSTMTYDGAVETNEGFEDETAARTALAARCPR